MILSLEARVMESSGVMVRHGLVLNTFIYAAVLGNCLLCSHLFIPPPEQPSLESDLVKNTYVELVDWHISGLWVINTPVAWIRVKNYNTVPIKNMLLEYSTFDGNTELLNHGTYEIEDEIPPRSLKNFFGEYLGLVNLCSDKLSIKLVSVKQAK